jgi:hypothetical protein
MNQESIYGNAILAGAANANTLYSVEPASDTADPFLTRTGRALTGQHFNTALTNDTGFTRYLACEVSVQYTGTRLNAGGTIVVVDGSREQSLLSNRSNPVALTYTEMAQMPLGTNRTLGTEKTTFRFINGSSVRNSFEEIPSDYTWAGLGAQVIPEGPAEFASLGYTTAVMVKSAAPGSAIIFSVTAWYEDCITETSSGTRQPLIPASHLSAGNPEHNTQQTTAAAFIANLLRTGGTPGFISKVGDSVAGMLSSRLGQTVLNAGRQALSTTFLETALESGFV